MPAVKRPLNAFGLQTLVKLNAFGITAAELAELMGVKPSNLSSAMRRENPSGRFVSKWSQKVDEALKRSTERK